MARGLMFYRESAHAVPRAPCACPQKRHRTRRTGERKQRKREEKKNVASHSPLAFEFVPHPGEAHLSAPPCLLHTPRLTENDAQPSMEHTFCSLPDGSFRWVESLSSDEEEVFRSFTLNKLWGSRDRAVEEGVSSSRLPAVGIRTFLADAGSFNGDAASTAASRASIILQPAQDF